MFDEITELLCFLSKILLQNWTILCANTFLCNAHELVNKFSDSFTENEGALVKVYMYINTVIFR